MSGYRVRCAAMESDLAAAVKARRSQLGRTQAEVCDRGGLGLKTLSRIERAERPTYHSTTLRALDRGLSWRAGSAHAHLTRPVRDGETAWLDAVVGALDALGPRRRAADEVSRLVTVLSDESVEIVRVLAVALFDAERRRAEAGPVTRPRPRP